MLTRRFDDAMVYAARLHAKQTRKGTRVPYVAHLLATASIVLEHGATEDEAIAALLHDAVEDQGGQKTLSAIRRRFGDTVADIVMGCSDTDATPKPPWRLRKEAHLRHLRRAPRSVRLVAAADKLHNARSIVADLRERGRAAWDRFNAGPEEQLWYYGAMVDVLSRKGPRGLAGELRRVVEEMRRLSAVTTSSRD